MEKDQDLMLSRARELRKNMTEQERKLWYTFLRKYPIKIYKQKILGNYIADFYCPQAKVVIELDGSQHFQGEGPEYDKRRTAFMEAKGIRVIRFTNREVNLQFYGICSEIDRVIQERIKAVEDSE